MQHRIRTSSPARADARYLGRVQKHGGEWGIYERQFLHLMRERKIEEKASREMLDGACLLCSEEKPHYCQRTGTHIGAPRLGAAELYSG